MSKNIIKTIRAIKIRHTQYSNIQCNKLVVEIKSKIVTDNGSEHYVLEVRINL